MRQPATTGVIPAVLTPVDGSGEPCFDLMSAHCRSLLEAGCGAIVLLGTTGEANSFSAPERMAILEGLVAAGMPASTFIVGTGCCAAADTIALTKHALSVGALRVLMLPPFYYKNVTDAGLIDAYSRVIDAIGDARLRVYLYRIPQISAIDIKAPVADALLDRFGDVLAGIKDSTPEFEPVADLCARFATRLDFLVGTERYLLKALALGASGCVSATANANAQAICELFKTKDPALQERVSAVRDMFEGLPVIAALKEYMARSTGDARWRNILPPLRPLSVEQAAALRDGTGAPA